MKVLKKVDINSYLLYDLFQSYVYSKKYSNNVSNLVQCFYTNLLEEINKNEDMKQLDIIDIKYFFIQFSDDGKINKIELNFECFILYNLLVNYINNKLLMYPRCISKQLNKIEKHLNKHIFKNGKILDENIVFEYIGQEITYEEGKDNGSKD